MEAADGKPPGLLASLARIMAAKFYLFVCLFVCFLICHLRQGKQKQRNTNGTSLNLKAFSRVKETTNKIERQPTELEEIFTNDMSDKGLIYKIPDVKNWLVGKDPDSEKDWRQEKGTTEDKIVGRHAASPRVCPSSRSLHCWCHPTSHPLTLSSPYALSLSQHQGFFQWIVCSHQMTKILALQLQHQSFWWIFRANLP